ncbi:hypothetical protein [Coprobacter tertius]|uniref:Uncharacterized protein n=1 Tax=Coprobacter tertius TaxID=2944915 RepID=A0ABT1MHV4_9BACT|nr:hypothetical protein [Coprobacter tertius]MCP9612213.1 hypothetical protein [Coprobacter tertius]
MKKGYFSHQLCYNGILLNKHILYIENRKIVSALPFQREISLTTFCEGILIATKEGFCEKLKAFEKTLEIQLQENKLLSAGNAIVFNPLYNDYIAREGDNCELYSLISINWMTYRLSQDKLDIIRIL